jgi:hypothetical protein
LADVEVVASYKLAQIHRTKLENVFHRIFASAQLDLLSLTASGIPCGHGSGSSFHFT